MGSKNQNRSIKMALSSSLATRCKLLSVSKGFRWIHSTSSLGVMKPESPSTSDAGFLREGFWDKNKRLQRPMSPHLTIYKPQMTSMLSITHRGTGLAQSVILTGFAVFGIASNYSYPFLLSQVAQLSFVGPPLIFLGKFAIAWPVMYHLFNGVRHLAWDMGHGFSMPELYKTGYTVLGLSIVFGIALALM